MIWTMNLIIKIVTIYISIIINIWEKDSIVKEPPVHIYYTYLKPTWGYGFNFLVVLYVG